MAWQDRIREGKYQGASGAELVFQFENVSRVIAKKTSVFTFSNIDGAFVQDRGAGTATFPVKMFIAGDDYDKAADAMVDLLSEKGAGKLTHPIYGVKTVVPIQISRRDDLVTGGGQATLDVQFIETITELFPRGIVNKKSDVRESITSFDDVSPASFDESVSLETSSETANFKSFALSTTAAIDTALSPITDGVDEIKREFDATVMSITDGIDILVSKPADLARQFNKLIRLPSLVSASLLSVFDAFSFLSTSQRQVTPKTVDKTGQNEYAIRRLVGYSALISLSKYTVDSANYRSRRDAIVASNLLSDEFEILTTWDTAEIDRSDLIDTGVIYQPAQEAVALESGRLVTETFDLPIERRFITDRIRNIIELSTSLYGNGDDSTVDFLIETNKFIGTELLQVPKGREVVFFK